MTPQLSWVDRAGADLELVQVVGAVDYRRLSHVMQVERKLRAGDYTLVLRVEGPAALEIQHKSDVLLERVNRFFGWHAVGRPLQLVAYAVPFAFQQHTLSVEGSYAAHPRK